MTTFGVLPGAANKFLDMMIDHPLFHPLSIPTILYSCIIKRRPSILNNKLAILFKHAPIFLFITYNILKNNNKELYDISLLIKSHKIKPAQTQFFPTLLTLLKNIKTQHLSKTNINYLFISEKLITRWRCFIFLIYFYSDII